MKFKIKLCNIEIEIILIIVILTAIISNTVYSFLYFFFACYLFIFFHELMHILIGVIFNKKLIKIKFSISGVCASFQKENKSKNKLKKIINILIYLAGPISNLMLAYIFKLNDMIKEINIFLAILNLLPIYPLDGYNIIINFLEIICDSKNSIKFTNILCNIVIILIIIVSLYQIITYKNFSLFIFCIYILVLKVMKKV